MRYHVALSHKRQAILTLRHTILEAYKRHLPAKEIYEQCAEIRKSLKDKKVPAYMLEYFDGYKFALLDHLENEYIVGMYVHNGRFYSVRKDNGLYPHVSVLEKQGVVNPYQLPLEFRYMNGDEY